MGIVGGAGNTDLSVGGDQQLFRLANVWAALEKIGRQAGRNFRRVRLLGEPQATSDGSRIVSEKNADEIFLLLNAAFKVGDFFTVGVDELFGLERTEVRRSDSRRAVRAL